MRALELKIPPPVVALLIAAGMWLLSSAFQPSSLSLGVRIAWGVGLAAMGQAISVSGMVAFRRARTTINPLNPGAATFLVQAGIYRYTRNPMYVGLLLSLAGWAAYLGQVLPVVGLPFFVWYITQFQIKPEERILAAMFGAEFTEFTEYLSKVRRWA
ncbi:MAG: isoprenylcysteine carboxylmethyltransferase family protein [Comamonadaceae bacterium]|nr:MAG: isoprenylcysteine carboxylmethyltransferase family protein [Comamonadaceae bacterium]